MSEMRREIEKTLAKYTDRILSWEETVEELETKAKVTLLVGMIIGIIVGFIVG